MAVALVGVIILFVVIYQRRLMRQQLHLQEVEAQQQQLLLAASIETQEAERQRIARDLHDEVGNMLSTVKMHLHTLSRRMEPEAPLREMVEQARGLLGDSIHTVRHLSHNLLPPTLERLGIIAALEELATRIPEPEVSFSHSGPATPLPLSISLGIYRIVQEAITNSLKHAAAQHIQIRLAFGPDRLVLTFTDDGKGFERGEVVSQGMGMRNMRSRAQVLGGDFALETSPGKGTLIRVGLPIDTSTLEYTDN